MLNILKILFKNKYLEHLAFFNMFSYINKSSVNNKKLMDASPIK